MHRSLFTAKQDLPPGNTQSQLYWLSAPAVMFTFLMIAFPFAYTVWLSLHDFTFGST